MKLFYHPDDSNKIHLVQEIDVEIFTKLYPGSVRLDDPKNSLGAAGWTLDEQIMFNVRNMAAGLGADNQIATEIGLVFWFPTKT